jgi:hypothetical protein
LALEEGPCVVNRARHVLMVAQLRRVPNSLPVTHRRVFFQRCSMETNG